MYWYIQVLSKYVDFSGRARMTEYWMFFLFNIIFSIVTVVIDNVADTNIPGLPYGVFYITYVLAVFIPGLAVAVRRLHDVGKSGWMMLIGLVPFIGSIWLLILMVTDSEPGENKYGVGPIDNNSFDYNVNNTHLSSNANETLTVDTIILIVIIWMLVSRFLQAILPNLIDDYYYSDWFKLINAVFYFISGLVPIGLAFAIKNKSKQIVLLILGGIYLLYVLYEISKYF